MIQLFKEWVNRYFSDPQVIILAFLLLLGFFVVFFLGNTLAPFFASLVIAYLLEGIVQWFEKFHVPRMVSVVLVFMLFLVFMVLLLVGLLPLLSRQVAQFFQEVPAMVARGQKALLLLPQKYPEIVTEEQIRQVISALNTELTRTGQYILSISLASVKGIIAILVYMILVPLMVFFFLKDKTKIIQWGTKFLPENRKLAAEVWYEVNQQVTNYVRGKIWEILIVGMVSFFTFKLLGINYTLLLSVFVGLSVIVPYIGATVMYLPVILISWFQWGWSMDFFYAVLAYSIIQALDGNLLVPLLLSEVVNLHPIAIIAAVLVFGGFWGIWGLFFAIPLATLVHSVIKAWFSKRNVPVHAEKETATG